MILGSLYNKYVTIMPKMPTPTTVIPMTEPPEKAILNASFIPLVAAKAVFPFARVATFIPKKPEMALQKAPSTNDTARGTPSFHASKQETTMTNTTRALYSL